MVTITIETNAEIGTIQILESEFKVPSEIIPIHLMNTKCITYILSVYFPLFIRNLTILFCGNHLVIKKQRYDMDKHPVTAIINLKIAVNDVGNTEPMLLNRIGVIYTESSNVQC